MDNLSWNNAVEMLCASGKAIIDNKALLTEIDSKIGDGDHGIGMSGGMEKAISKLEKTEDTGNIYDAFTVFGKTMLMSMGGASGVIFGSMFLAGAKDVSPKSNLTATDFADMMERSLAAIKERGKAQLGDKTMVDAFEPAVLAMKDTADKGFVAMLKAAEEAAAEGVEATKNMQANFGRAKSLMERAIGFQDAGATSVLIILRAMRIYSQATDNT